LGTVSVFEARRNVLMYWRPHWVAPAGLTSDSETHRLTHSDLKIAKIAIDHVKSRISPTDSHISEGGRVSLVSEFNAAIRDRVHARGVYIILQLETS
jgi:hypothetical protein